MSINRVSQLTPILVLILLLFSACNMPSAGEPTQDDAGLIHTIAAQTVEAQLTLDAASGGQETQQTPGGQPGEPTATSTNTPLPTDTQPPPTNTPVPTATITPIPCDHITWGKDVTIPDGTEMVPGEVFTKTWRLKNTGSCTWTSGYSLVFQSGDKMGAPDAVQLTTGTVTPGQGIDVSVVLKAPVEDGTYQGNFKLRNTQGTIFGLGAESKPFWVKIVVPEISGVMLDFIAIADDSDWGSGVKPIDFSGPGDIQLTYDSPITDTGYVTTHDNVNLEGGGKSGVILETHPKNENDGYIIGRYPKYKVGAGDYIQARIGFLAKGGGGCGAGNAIFRIDYTIENDLDTRKTLGSWHEKCDGILRKITIDLSDLTSKTVRFYIIVLTNGAPTDDYAIWDSLGVMR